MGKVIICTGAYAGMPYEVPETGRKLYSLEEICFYIYNNIYSIDVPFFTDELCTFLYRELKLTTLAERIYKLRKENQGLKKLVTEILCAADYYDRGEIRKLLTLMDEFIGMTSWQKRTHMADEAMRDGRFNTALRLYGTALGDRSLTEQDYGSILFRMGLCEIHTAPYRDAAESFYHAYLHSRDVNALYYALLTYKVAGLDEEYDRLAREIPGAKTVLTDVEMIWENSVSKAMDSDDYRRFDEYLALFDEGKTEEALKGFDGMLQDYKDEYRRNV